MSALKHYKQIEMMNDQSRFKFVLAGRRGGKTRGMAELIAEDVYHCPPGGTIFFIGPTNLQSMELIWEPLFDRFDELGWNFKALVSKQRFVFSRRRTVQIIGAEKIRRIRGRKAFRVYMDEIAFWGVDLFQAWRAIRPALSDLKGRAVAATTPDGKGSPAYQFYRAVMEPKKNSEGQDTQPWKYFEWTTLDNPFMDPQEIEDARTELDPKSFNQEYCAKWESFEGLAYYQFQEGTHIARESIKTINENSPIGLCFDFNVNPTSLLICQEQGGKLLFRREYSLKNSSTLMTVRNFCEDYKHLAKRCTLEIYGDASGSANKSNTGKSDYHYVKEILNEYGFTYQMKVTASNPAIIDRVAHVNAFLMNTKGESRILIDPSCKDLITDLASQKLEGRIPSDKGNLGHKADALGYRVFWAYLMSRKTATNMNRVIEW